MATVDRPTRAATHMSVATLASRGIGFVRVWVIAAVLGTTFLGNAYQSSSSVSNVLFELLAAGALSAVLVPSFVHLLEAGGDREAENLASGLLGLALAVMGVVCVIGVILAPQIARLLSSGVHNPEVEQQQIALSTFLLRFFIPQVLLYVLGTVATAILFAKRRFVVTAMAPIANTVFVVGALVLFRVVAGPNPGLDLTLDEKLILAIGGLLGVAGFVGVPVVALMRSGFKFRPRIVHPDAHLRRVLHLSAWAVFQHAGIGILLGTAIVVGNQVEGGVIAYQFAFVAFMAAYSILAQPVHTTILPDMSLDANRGDTFEFADRVRWALDRMAILVLPVSAAYLALSLPAMKVIAPASSSPELLAAALASLGVGLFVYSAFLLLARGVLRARRQPDTRAGRARRRPPRFRGGDRRCVRRRRRTGAGGDARCRAQRGLPRGRGAAVRDAAGAARTAAVPTIVLACVADLGGARRGGLGRRARACST